MPELKSWFYRHKIHSAEARYFGMMCACPKRPKSVVCRTHIDSPVFVPYRRSMASSVMHSRGSSAWFAGEKNGLRNLWDGAFRLVRPKDASSERSALRRPSDLSGAGGATGRLPALRHREERAARDVPAERAAHRALRPLHRGALPQRHDPGCGEGAASGLAHGQAARDAVHARATWRSISRSGSAVRTAAKRAWTSSTVSSVIRPPNRFAWR